MAANGPIGDEGEESAEQDIGKGPQSADRRIGGPPPTTIGRRKLLIGAGGVAVVALVGGGAYVIGSGSSKSDKSKSNSTTVDPTFTTFRDPGAGFSIAHPQSWTPLPNTDPDVHLLLSAGATGVDSFSVRVLPSQNVDPNNLTDVKAFTDSVLSGQPITVLDQKAVTINAVHGYYYLYTFDDTSTKQKLVHSHYFLYQGHSMYFLVFQSLVPDFSTLAPAAGKAVDSFRTFPPSASPTTTAPAPKP